MTQRHEVSERRWNNGISRLAWCRVTTNLQSVENAVSAKCNKANAMKRGMPVFRNTFHAKQKCHEGGKLLFIYCKETSPGRGAGARFNLPAVILWCDFGQASSGLNEGLGNLAAKDSLACRLACVLSHSCTRRLGSKGRVRWVCTWFSPDLASPQTPSLAELLPDS